MEKRLALSQLRQSRVVYERGLARQEGERRLKLHRFLDQHQHAKQWATALAAIEDAVQHGVAPNDAALCQAISQCGLRGQLRAAKHLYTDVYRRLSRPRPLVAHVTFMTACADAGDFVEAHRQFCALRDRDVALHAKNAQHRPVVNDDLTTAYLRAALCGSLAAGKHTSTGGASPIPVPNKTSDTEEEEEGRVGATKDAADPSSSGETVTQNSKEKGKKKGCASDAVAAPWQVALDSFLALRRDHKLFRAHNELTPLLLEHATQLACIGGKWELSLAILRGAEATQALIPPEAYDASIRACFRAQRHTEVVRLMAQLTATRVPPDEQSVRLALLSSEEVSAMERRREGVVPSVSSNSSSSAVPIPPKLAQGWSMALTLFHALERNGFPLYQQSYEAPLRACVNAGKWREAFEMLAVMRRDHRPISAPLYAVTLASRVEAAGSWPEVQRLLRVSALADGPQSSAVLMMAALRACMRLQDWTHFAELNREMRNREMPETYDKMRLLIEAAFLQGKYHSVLMRFARFENITQFERRRVVKDQLVRLYDEDFDLSPALLQMVLDAYGKQKGHRDPMVEAAYQAALRHKERLSVGQTLTGDHTAPDEWMYSQAAREARAPSDFN